MPSIPGFSNGAWVGGHQAQEGAGVGGGQLFLGGESKDTYSRTHFWVEKTEKIQVYLALIFPTEH